MSFIAPDHGDRGEPDIRVGRSGGSAIGEDFRLVRNGTQVLARGALICPECALPISPAPRIGLRDELWCAYCDHTAEALAFLRRDVVDAPANDALVVARID